MFDQLTIEKLNFYVYALIDPRNNKPFYIGKGTGNRVFTHVDELMGTSTDSNSKKNKYIHGILKENRAIQHLVIRHNLTEHEAFKLEATLIDCFTHFGETLVNEIAGIHSHTEGIMTTEELIRKYNASPLKELSHPAVIININKKYIRGEGTQYIYSAVKEAWIISDKKRELIKFALAEYQGIISEVFKIDNWYSIQTSDKNGNRWGFEGEIARDDIRELYINKSVAHTKKKGAAFPLKYKL